MNYQFSDAGRFQFEHNDCAVRALAEAAGLTYLAAWQELRDAGRKPRRKTKYVVSRKVFEQAGAVLRPDLGARKVGLALSDMQQGRFAVKVSGHFFAVVDGVVRDLTPVSPNRVTKAVYQFV